MSCAENAQMLNKSKKMISCFNPEKARKSVKSAGVMELWIRSCISAIIDSTSRAFKLQQGGNYGGRFRNLQND